MTDLISRQAAIDALFELYEYQRDIDPTEAADLVRQGIYLAEKKIEKLPSAQQWIPCSERLPEAEVEVFVYLFDRPSPHIAWMSKDGKWHTEDFTLEVDENPAAWMPLPEPYKEGQDEQRN